jgi:hypothetical protein
MRPIKLLTTILFAAITLVAAHAQSTSLTVVNPDFANVAVQCSVGFAYDNPKTDCGSWLQEFNNALGIGWTFLSNSSGNGGDGLTGPNTDFEPPPFDNLPFDVAVFLQGNNAAFEQTVSGFVPGGVYTLNFYLGSRYTYGGYSGNQTVQATIDSQVIGTWALTSNTPFTLRTVPFTVATGGSHVLEFLGIVSGDETAFVSGVSLHTVSGGLTVTPSTGVPGIDFAASASGFTPLETVTLIAYASAPVGIATATADSSGVASLDGHLPQTPFGALGFIAAGQSSGVVRSGVISLRPRLSVAPASGAAGSTVTATGFGFAAGETINLEWSSPQTSLGNSRANKDGTFSAEVVIPSGAPAGPNRLIAIGQRTGAAASTAVTVP